MELLTLFCHVDDFCQGFEPQFQARLLETGERRRRRASRLSNSEIMTILIFFHASNYRTFKHYYLMLTVHHQAEFPNLLSYSRFVRILNKVAGPLCAYLTFCFGACTGISFIDSTRLPVCGNKRTERNRVFEDIAQLGKSSMGWFFGFKLHIVVNDQGELLAARLTPGNVDDRTVVPDMVKNLTGHLFGDKGYISAQLFSDLFSDHLKLVTPIRRNRKNRLVPLAEKLLLRKRSLIETINDQLKNVCQICHTRHRSACNAMVHLVAGLVCYQHQPKKPKLRLSESEQEILREGLPQGEPLVLGMDDDFDGQVFTET